MCACITLMSIQVIAGFFPESLWDRVCQDLWHQRAPQAVTSGGVENHYDFLVNLWARFPVVFMNTLSFIQVFDFSQVFGPCGPVPSCKLSPAKPPKVQMETLWLVIAVSRSEQQLETLPEENGVKQVQGCRKSRLWWWDSYTPIRATISAQKKYLFLLFFFPLQCIFSSCSLFFVEPESRLLCAYQASSSGTSRETWDLILSQTLYIDQERLSSRREERKVSKNR